MFYVRESVISDNRRSYYEISANKVSFRILFFVMSNVMLIFVLNFLAFHELTNFENGLLQCGAKSKAAKLFSKVRFLKKSYLFATLILLYHLFCKIVSDIDS